MNIPGIEDLLKEIKSLEDFVRASRSRDELRSMLLTQEEAEVVESYRRFITEDYA